MFKRMTYFVNDNDLLFMKQFRFRENHGTQDAITSLTSDILNGFKDNTYTLSLFIDLRKAFDTIDHGILLRNVEQMGFTGTVLDWFTSCLTNRTQYVCINGKRSTKKVLNVGYHKGVLAPQLFLYVINNMFEYLRFRNCILVADDTTIYVSGRNVRFLKLKLQSDLNNLSLWLIENKLVLYVKKTKTMLFRPRNTILHEDINLKINGENIENVETFKFLGVWFDHHLEWNTHAQVLLNKISQNSYLLKRLHTLLLKNILETLYYAHINIHLTYGMFALGSMLSMNQINRISKAQENVCKFIPSTNIIPVKSLIKLEMCKFINKFNNSKLPKPLVNIFPKSTHGYETRNQHVPAIQIHQSSIYNQSFLVKSITEWLKIPNTIKVKLSLMLYKRYEM